MVAKAPIWELRGEMFQSFVLVVVGWLLGDLSSLDKTPSDKHTQDTLTRPDKAMLATHTDLSYHTEPCWSLNCGSSVSPAGMSTAQGPHQSVLYIFASVVPNRKAGT